MPSLFGAERPGHRIKDYIFNLMEINQIEMTQQQCKRLVLLVHEEKEKLKGTHVLDYIRKGEKDGKFHLRSTCAARKPWYSLPDIRGPIVWSMIHQYKHIAAYNVDRLAVNHNMFVISPNPGIEEQLLLAVLNSTVQELFKRLYGRSRNEGVVKTEGIDIAIMPVVNCKQLGQSQKDKVLRSFRGLKARDIRQMVNVGTREDRRMLDSAVLEALGIPHADVNVWLERLYALLKETYRLERLGELQMVAGRQGETKQRRIKPELLADEIWNKELGVRRIRLFPDNFLDPDEQTVRIHISSHFAEDKRPHHVDKFQCCLVKGDTAIDSPHEGGLAMLDIAAELGISGDISIPVNSDAAYRVVADFRNYWKKFKQIVKEYVEKRSPEAKRQKAITAAIFEMYRNREPAGTGDLTN